MVSTVLNMYFLFKQVERVETAETEEYEIREWLTFASLNFLTTIIDTVLDSIDTIILAAFGVSDIALGQYGAAMRLGNFIAMPLLSINNVFAPTIAELHSKGEMEKLETMFKVVTKWTIAFSLPIFMIIVLFSPYLLALPGASFIQAWPLLIAFAVGGLINAGTGAVGYMLLMTGYQRLSFLNSLVAVVVNITLGILLTPHYGAMGTAISTGLAICALNLMRLLQVRVLLKIHPYRRDVLKPIMAGLISSVLVGGALYLLKISHLQTAIQLGHAILSAQLLLIPVLVAIYIGLIIFFKGSPEDEIVLKALRKKFLRGGKNKQKSN
jgi:O-antigen/teichoic acid export membrane protein